MVFIVNSVSFKFKDTFFCQNFLCFFLVSGDPCFYFQLADLAQIVEVHKNNILEIGPPFYGFCQPFRGKRVVLQRVDMYSKNYTHREKQVNFSHETFFLFKLLNYNFKLNLKIACVFF